MVGAGRAQNRVLKRQLDSNCRDGKVTSSLCSCAALTGCKHWDITRKLPVLLQHQELVGVADKRSMARVFFQRDGNSLDDYRVWGYPKGPQTKHS